MSVVIPVYNGEKYIAQAIESALSQEVDNLEIIVVDDGSSDMTKEIVKGFKDSVSYIYQDNSGPSSARNTGIKHSHGKFIAFLDSDDLWAPDKLKIQLEKFNRYDELDIVLGFNVKGQFNSVTEINTMISNMPSRFSLYFGSALIRRSTFDEIGLLDEDLIMGEDTDWFYRAREMNRSICVHKDVVEYHRRHDSNLTNDKKRAVFYYLKMMKKAKDRKTSLEMSEMTNIESPTDLDEIIGYWHTV